MKSTVASYVYVWVCPVCNEKQYRDLDHNFGIDKCCGSTLYRVKPPREDLSGSALRATRRARRQH